MEKRTKMFSKDLLREIVVEKDQIKLDKLVDEAKQIMMIFSKIASSLRN